MRNKTAPLYTREWGTEKNTTPLQTVHPVPSDFSIAYSRVAIVITVFFWLAYASSVIIRQLIDGPQNYQFTSEAFGYALLVSFLTLSALLYLITRQGALQAFSKHRRVPQRTLDEHFHTHQSTVTVLVPSYDEETEVIRKTLLSAALQEKDGMRVVLLLDDAPDNTSERLTATRALPDTLTGLMEVPAQRAGALVRRVQTSENASTADTITAITTTYLKQVQWLETLAEKESLSDHVDIFFKEQVLLALATELRDTAVEITALHRDGVAFSQRRLQQLANRLAAIFTVEFDIFERKRYISLSHERNKAMNLNSYIGLMGNMYKEAPTGDGIVLLETDDTQRADRTVPKTDYVLTLDADSVLLAGYCSRLIYFLEEPKNKDVAVAQTPYSSFRGAPKRLERISGATTDIQHILHQGMSYYDAAFWVGANAIIRYQALQDIAEEEHVGGFTIRRFVQDHTVIEDTESSIDLALKDWRVVNYPERLSYSATPPDFGSLVVQRLRWANGGALIFPKLLKLRTLRKHSGRPLPLIAFLIRANYTLSIAWSSFGLVLLLAYPYDGRLLSPLILLAALPYFVAMAMDLRYCRYRWYDIFNIYGFNLILLPVNIAGTLKSFQQAATTKKIPFARTPKVKDRTATGPLYLLAPVFIVAFSAFTLWRNIEGENWGNAAFAGFNTLTATWAIVRYIGIRNLCTDLILAFVNWLFVEVPVTEIQQAHRFTLPTFAFTRKTLNS